MPQPRGSSDYVRQLKNRAIAATYAPRQGISLDASALLSVRTGQKPQVVQPLIGLAYDVSGCCCTPPTNDINLVAYLPIALMSPINGYNYMATVSWEDNGSTSFTLTILYADSETNAHAVSFDTFTSATVMFQSNPGSYTAEIKSFKPCGTSVATATAVCETVCDLLEFPPSWIKFDVSGNESGFPLEDLQEALDSFYGSPQTIPAPPDGYPLDYFIAVNYPNCNGNTLTVSILDGLDNVITSQNTDYGFTSEGGIIIMYPESFDSETYRIVFTISNDCSSSTGDAQLVCFLAGTPVSMADGTTKPIETVVVGDRVVGAFGEINTVTGTQTPLLGLCTISNINGEHKTTSHHPHITTDHKFGCVRPGIVSSFAYGKYHMVKGANGVIEKRLMKGVKPERVVKLEVGMTLQTVTGPRAVTTIEHVPMPPSTPVYHLATNGSHTYVVDGYAVAGWANEEDFDYDTWTSKV